MNFSKDRVFLVANRLLLAVSVCPAYCTFCTREEQIGPPTEAADKNPPKKKWADAFAYIESQPDLQDIVVSGGDTYYLLPDQITLIGERLLSMPNIKRIRFASKGLAVAPARFLDESDGWVDALIGVSNLARRVGKTVALHTHFNHTNEISWITRRASRKLLEAGVTVRNQTVLLRGVNDSVEEMSKLIRQLGEAHINPVSISLCFDPLVTESPHLTIRDDSTMSISATWSRKLSTDERLCRRFWTSR